MSCEKPAVFIQPADMTVYPDGSMLPRDFVLPEQFTVREPRFTLVLGIIMMAMFVPLFLVCLFVMAFPEEFGYTALSFGMVLFSLWALLDYRNRRLEVDGTNLCYINSLGRCRSFTVFDITAAIPGSTWKLLGKDGAVLAKFESNMSNCAFLMSYLADHQVKLKQKRF